MSPQKRIGVVLMALGLLALVVGAVLTIGGGDDPDEVAVAIATANPTTTTSQVPTTATAPTTTTTAQPTTTTAPTTTTTAATTTSTVPIPTAADVEAFIAAFAQAIADRDVEFLFAKLHPVAVAQSTEASCRSLIETEIVLLEDYRVTGDVSVEQRTVSVGEDTFEVDPFFVVPVTFTFQGTEFNQAANLGAFEGEVRWFTACG